MNFEPKVEAGRAEQVRLFIAITLPDEVRVELRKVQRELKEVWPAHGATWTRPENMHLTLRFLGNVESSQIPELSAKLKTSLTGFGELPLVCERLGCFPDLRYPRVIWSWVHDEAGQLRKLFHQIDEAVSQFAERPAEKVFTGHITLARPKQITRPEAERLARFVEGAVRRGFGQWTVQSVSLIQSQLSPTGATHTELCRAALQ